MPEFREYRRSLDLSALNTRSVDAAKVTEHHALIITGIVPEGLSEAESTVYTLIAGRMLEAFSPPCEKELLLMECVCGGLDFHSRSTVIANPGWRAVFSRKEDREKDEPERDEGTASFTEGEEIPVMGHGLSQKKTLPKPHYTEATLLTAIDNCGKEITDGQAREAVKDTGIGTPATRAAIIETLFAREYVRREKKSLVPTDKGLAVYAVVRDKKIADVAMTGGWELALSKIATGEMDAPTFHRGIEVFTSQIAKELLEARIDGAESDTACPRCGRPVVFYPKLAKCQNPDCGLTVWRTVGRKELTDKQLAELLTKGKTGTIRGFVKNGGGTFDAALTLDDQFKTSFVFEPRDTPRQGKRNKRK